MGLFTECLLICPKGRFFVVKQSACPVTVSRLPVSLGQGCGTNNQQPETAVLFNQLHITAHRLFPGSYRDHFTVRNNIPVYCSPLPSCKSTA